METIRIEKNIPVVGRYDVVVCGGGPAGFIAAIAAARKGASVALVEQYGFLGGMATTSYVAPLSVFTYKGRKVIGGIPWEFIERLEELGGGLIEKPLGNVAFDPELYKLLCQRMVLEAGVKLYLHSYLSGCVCGDGRISQVIIENKSGSQALDADVFIDCTGDADLAYMAGVPMQDKSGRPLQPMSSYFILNGVDTDSPMVREAMHHNKQGENCYCLPMRKKMLELQEELDIPDFGGPWYCTTLHDGCVAVNVTRVSADACDAEQLSAAECSLREDCFRMAGIFRKLFPEFRNCYVASVAVNGGVRETRNIKGMHVISAQEYLNAFHYEDSISRGAHPIDIHASKGASQSVTFLEEPAYVPYRALIAEGFPNLLVAGRCLSADRVAFASLRVQASCMGSGQAAGVAAALASASGVAVQDVDVPALVAELKDMGAQL
ncbi:MAG: FAD-dependent oxidoreductase [Bacteroidales bacterium]|nr:FAD-dependent oxidoreductase [Bacteroidales bacterium]MCI7750341.1 FAD-dependent oxidoreductase [Bacteroidales bacterium]MDD6113761.1 FAD-dependent oxidoreductase [Bacteroidales bacterium]MDD6509505.1 FAD-dependent oxidoreductase [Bacteroidales bacterium]MDD6809394.1 FAD-dependent oxidoreductase [Bacteroidales bacterium]